MASRSKERARDTFGAVERYEPSPNNPYREAADASHTAVADLRGVSVDVSPETFQSAWWHAASAQSAPRSSFLVEDDLSRDVGEAPFSAHAKRGAESWQAASPARTVEAYSPSSWRQEDGGDQVPSYSAQAQRAPAYAARQDLPRYYSHEESQRLEQAEAARRSLDAQASLGGEGSGSYQRFEQPLAVPVVRRTPRFKEAPRPSRPRIAPQKLHFWRWFRTLPILGLILVAVASASVELGLFGIREYLYPLHYTQELSQLADTYGVNPLLVASVVRTESGWNPNAASAAGAQGLMQLLPETAQELAESGLVDASRYDPNNLLDPETNLAYGTAYLSWCLEQTGSLDEAIAAYNAGIGAAQAWAAEDTPFAEAITYPETAGYLERVKESLGWYDDTYPNGVPQEDSGE